MIKIIRSPFEDRLTLEPSKNKHEFPTCKNSLLINDLDKRLYSLGIKTRYFDFNECNLKIIYQILIDIVIKWFMQVFVPLNNTNLADVLFITFYTKRLSKSYVSYHEENLTFDRFLNETAICFKDIQKKSKANKDAYRELMTRWMNGATFGLCMAKIVFIKTRTDSIIRARENENGIKDETLISVAPLFERFAGDECLTPEQHIELSYHGLMNVSKMLHYTPESYKIFNLQDDIWG